MKHRKTGFLRRLVLTYSAFLLVFMLVLVGAIKMSDRIIRELMGLG